MRSKDVSAAASFGNGCSLSGGGGGGGGGAPASSVTVTEPVIEACSRQTYA